MQRKNTLKVLPGSRLFGVFQTSLKHYPKATVLALWQQAAPGLSIGGFTKKLDFLVGPPLGFWQVMPCLCGMLVLSSSRKGRVGRGARLELMSDTMYLCHYHEDAQTACISVASANQGTKN